MEALEDNYSMFESKNECWLHCVYLSFRICNMLNVSTTHSPLARIQILLKKEIETEI